MAEELEPELDSSPLSTHPEVDANAVPTISSKLDELAFQWAVQAKGSLEGREEISEGSLFDEGFVFYNSRRGATITISRPSLSKEEAVQEARRLPTTHIQIQAAGEFRFPISKDRFLHTKQVHLWHFGGETYLALSRGTDGTDLKKLKKPARQMVIDFLTLPESKEQLFQAITEQG